MQFFQITARVLASLCALVAGCMFSAVPASAKGTISIHHTDGDVNVYNDVEIKVIHGNLYLTSEDGKGTIIVHKAACSFQGKIMQCFATNATLVQAGETSPLDLKTGTVYLNDTGDPQPLVLSSAKVPPHSVLLSLSTDRGTLINLNGRIDQVVK